MNEHASLRAPVDSTRPPAFHEMNEHPKRFERMSVELLALDKRFKEASLFGVGGEAQYGADGFAVCCAGGTAVLSAKCYERTAPSTLAEWSSEFLDHYEAFWGGEEVRYFILATAATNINSRESSRTD
jgi:hypothetical protein